MRHVCFRFVVLATLGLAACGPSIKSVDYYREHPDEARATIETCKSQPTAADDNCKNARAVISEIESNTLHKRVFGPQPKQPNYAF